jgi:hypothetical protein
MRRLENIRNRNKKIQSTIYTSNFNTFKNCPELYGVNFPTIQKNASQNMPAWSSQQHSPNTRAFESSANNNSNNELFSPSQCMDIFNEFLGKLNNCHSKIDQIRVIAEITFKYMSK